MEHNVFDYIFYVLEKILELVFCLYFIYYIFIGDIFGSFIKEKREKSNKKITCQKLAEVKMTSNNTKEIENFIVENVLFLSENTIKKLILRIDDINNDRVITADNIMSKKDEKK